MPLMLTKIIPKFTTYSVSILIVQLKLRLPLTLWDAQTVSLYNTFLSGWLKINDGSWTGYSHLAIRLKIMSI